MAPLYDLASAFAYEPRRGGYDLGKAALSIGGRRKFGEVLRKNVELHADELRLDRAERLARVAELATAAAPAFQDALDAVDTPAAAEIAARLVPRLTRHCEEIVERVERGRPAT